MNDTALASGNILRFRGSLLFFIKILIMAIDNNVKDEKIRYSTKTEALSFGKIDIFEYYTGAYR